MSNSNAVAFRPVLRETVRGRDVLVLLVVPAVLVGTFLLPTSLKRSLAFSYVDPTILTAYSAHFTHLTVGHLGANLVGYFVLATTGYLLAALAGRQKAYGIFLASVLIVFPPTLSVLNMAVPRNAITYGFSGINMALAGILPLLLTEYAAQRLDERLKPRFSPGIFFLVMAVIALVAVPTGLLTMTLATASALIAVVYAYQQWQSLEARDGRRGARSPIKRGGWLEMGVLGAIVAVGYPVIGYPIDPATISQVVNIYVHTLGYALAFIGTYAGWELGILD